MIDLIIVLKSVFAIWIIAGLHKALFPKDDYKLPVFNALVLICTVLLNHSLYDYEVNRNFILIGIVSLVVLIAIQIWKSLTKYKKEIIGDNIWRSSAFSAVLSMVIVGFFSRVIGSDIGALSAIFFIVFASTSLVGVFIAKVIYKISG